MICDLLPGQGVHTLQFGDVASTAREVFGAAIERTHLDSFSLEFEHQGLTLFFSDPDKLSRVFADGSSDSVRLFGIPISQFFTDYPGLSDLSAWASSHGYEPQAPEYALGVYDLRIPALHLSFVIGEDGYTGVDLTPGTQQVGAGQPEKRCESIDCSD